MTFSAGIAAAPDHASTARELLRAGDAARCAAKEAGRDRVVLYAQEA
jgi:GGDEF domain-containing protein